MTVIHQPHRLVVHEAIHIALLGDIVISRFATPTRPMVRTEYQIHAVAEQLQHIGEMARPNQRIARLRAARRIEIVHHAIDFLSHAKRVPLRQIEHKLGRGFRPRRQLKLNLHPVQHQLLAGRGNVIGRGQQGDGTKGHALAQPAINRPLRGALQQIAEHITGAAAHRIAGNHVFAGHFLDEMLGRDKANAPARQIIFIGQRANTGKMVGMAVRRQNGFDGALAEMAVDQLHRRIHCFGGGQRVNHNPTRIAFDESHIGEVIAAHLVNALGHLKQAVNGIQACLPPQAGVHRVGTRAVEIFEIGHVPDHAAGRVFNDQRFGFGQLSARRQLKVFRVFKRQAVEHFFMRRFGCSTWRFGVHICGDCARVERCADKCGSQPQFCIFHDIPPVYSAAIQLPRSSFFKSLTYLLKSI